MKLVTILSSTIALAVTAGASGAATATFDLRLNPGQSTNYNSLPSSFDLTVGGVTAVFDGKYFNGDVYYNGSTNLITSATVGNGHIGRYSSGAGVVNSSGDGSHTVDGAGWNDFVEIRFSQSVTITSVSFGAWESDDDFRWMWDASGNGRIGVGDYISGNQDDNPFSSFGGQMSNVFGFAAFGDNDDWKLRTVSIDYSVSEVPLPAGGILLLTGIGGLIAARRKKLA